MKRERTRIIVVDVHVPGRVLPAMDFIGEDVPAVLKLVVVDMVVGASGSKGGRVLKRDNQATQSKFFPYPSLPS